MILVHTKSATKGFLFTMRGAFCPIVPLLVTNHDVGANIVNPFELSGGKTKISKTPNKQKKNSIPLSYFFLPSNKKMVSKVLKY